MWVISFFPSSDHCWNYAVTWWPFMCSALLPHYHLNKYLAEHFYLLPKTFFFFFNSVPLSVIYQFLSFLPSLSEDKVWTTVYHDLQMQTAMGGNSPDKFSVLQLNYSATMDQISAITSSAEYCEQFISYSCKMSRLLNTPGRLRMGYPLNTVLKSFISTI